MLRRQSDRRRLLLAAALSSVWLARRRESDSGYRLGGKVVLITGGSRGLGLALAREMVTRGARLAICGRDADSLDRARAPLARAGAKGVAIPADVTDTNSVRQLIEQVMAELGPVDVL